MQPGREPRPDALGFMGREEAPDFRATLAMPGSAKASGLGEVAPRPIA